MHCRHSMTSAGVFLATMLFVVGVEAQSPPLVPSHRTATPRATVETQRANATQQGDAVEERNVAVLAETPVGHDAAAVAEVVAQVSRELAALRLEVMRLRQSVEELSATEGPPRGATTLEEQNAQLRELLDYASEHPEVLRQGGARYLDEIDNGDPPELPEQTDSIPPHSPPQDPTVGPNGYSIVKEWGRTPEMVATLNAEVSTLKGMILVVSPVISNEELIGLGHELREEFAEYDNINIEVYNDLRAAQQYAETNVGDPKHRVLSVSKFGASGRDVILLIRGDEVTIVD